MTTDVLESFDWLIEEIDEAKEEYKLNKQVYLEDELCDIVWTVLRITELLDKK
jgi:NTP pyrophosphatase (non-canonical NTP hydrolase)